MEAPSYPLNMDTALSATVGEEGLLYSSNICGATLSATGRRVVLLCSSNMYGTALSATGCGEVLLCSSTMYSGQGDAALLVQHLDARADTCYIRDGDGGRTLHLAASADACYMACS